MCMHFAVLAFHFFFISSVSGFLCMQKSLQKCNYILCKVVHYIPLLNAFLHLLHSCIYFLCVSLYVCLCVCVLCLFPYFFSTMNMNHIVPCNILKNLATVCSWQPNPFLAQFSIACAFFAVNKAYLAALVVDWMYTYTTDWHTHRARHTHMVFISSVFLSLHSFLLILCVPVINFPLNDAWLHQTSSAHVLGITIILRSTHQHCVECNVWIKGCARD